MEHLNIKCFDLNDGKLCWDAGTLYTLRAIRKTDRIIIREATQISHNVWDVYIGLNICLFMSSFGCTTLYDQAIMHSSAIKPFKHKMQKTKTSNLNWCSSLWTNTWNARTVLHWVLFRAWTDKTSCLKLVEKCYTLT